MAGSQCRLSGSLPTTLPESSPVAHRRGDRGIHAAVGRFPAAAAAKPFRALDFIRVKPPDEVASRLCRSAKQAVWRLQRHDERADGAGSTSALSNTITIEDFTITRWALHCTYGHSPLSTVGINNLLLLISIAQVPANADLIILSTGIGSPFLLLYGHVQVEPGVLCGSQPRNVGDVEYLALEEKVTTILNVTQSLPP